MTLQDVCVYADPEERNEIFEYLDGLEVEYHKQYKRFNKIVKVPRAAARRFQNLSDSGCTTNDASHGWRLKWPQGCGASCRTLLVPSRTGGRRGVAVSLRAGAGAVELAVGARRCGAHLPHEPSTQGSTQGVS